MNRKEFVFATNNQHKLAEVRRMLGDRYLIRSLKELGFDEEIPEPYDTFEANALTKAETVFKRYELPTFADDSGLVIDSLDGAPGVLSARYAGESCSAEDNIVRVLKEMQGIQNRKARFVAVIAFVQEGDQNLFRGEIEGDILENPRTKGKGFGYDPIFQPQGFEHSFAEMEFEAKNKISHRALAVDKMCTFIKNLS